MLNTYGAWLVYELFRGFVTAHKLDWSEVKIRNFVDTRKSANPHLCAPFTDFNTNGVEGMLEHSDVIQLVQILRDIEPKFAA